MEEPQSDPAWGDDRSLKTTDSLRALRNQADQRFDRQRGLVSEIEARLNDQLQLISEELARERRADEQAESAAAEQAAMLQQLRQAVDEKEAEVDELLEQLAVQSLDVEAQLAERDEELEQVLAVNEAEHQQLATLQQELESARQAWEELRDQECDDCLVARAELAGLQQELASVRQAWEELRDQECDDCLVARAELADLQQELASVRQTWEELRDQECEDCAKTRAELTEVSQQLQALEERFRALQGQHETQQAELDELQNTSRTAEALREQATAALADAEQRIAELNELELEREQNDEQLEQTRRKFELAVADVHKLKRENAELHEELLSRPAAGDQESPELVSLRTERDALAERIAELERAPAPMAAADGQQELEDLQRRFEMAVDDVRQLKQENAQLSQQLKAMPAAAVGTADEAQDWQSQKARLLASLDAEDLGATNEARVEERATVAGAITLTDRIVAEKDLLLAEQEAEIAALRSKLEAQPARQDVDELRDQIAAEILGDDQAVQVECEKLRQKQTLLDAKLREAELEISVQRATLARERSALDEKLARLPAAGTLDDPSPADKPRRRWLSALGIKDEEES